MFKKIDKSEKPAITVIVDGTSVAAETTDTVASVLLGLEPVWSRTTPISGLKRAPYCMMGVCFECLALVDGKSVQACLVPVKDGMKIERQLGRRSFVS